VERFPEPDIHVLRGLAQQAAEFAHQPVEQEKRALWYRHNALEKTRPVIFCDPENGWNEIITSDDLICQDGRARAWEFALRREIFYGARMKDDRVIIGILESPHVFTETDMGFSTTFHRSEPEGAYAWDAPLKDLDDLDKLHFTQICIDHTATQEQFEMMQEIFGGILEVRLKSVWWWTLGMTMTLAYLRGMAQIMYDMIDAPDRLHRLMAFLRDAQMQRLDWLEENNLLFLNNDGSYVGSGGFGWTNELPGDDFAGHVRTMDMWGFAESQETVGISPEMFAEFVLPYQMPFMERFGLNCYGCCEPLDKRWKYVRQIPRLRRVSVSPWADVSRMAENLQDKYIFSLKPNPSDLAAPHFDEDHIRRTLRDAMEKTKGCRLEVIMKDCHTIASEPERVVKWVRIAREEADRIAEKEGC
jgi:hypothetical protein